MRTLNRPLYFFSESASGTPFPDAVFPSTTSTTTLRITESAFSEKGASQESEGSSIHLLATLSDLINLRS